MVDVGLTVGRCMYVLYMLRIQINTFYYLRPPLVMTDMIKTGNGGHQERLISGWLLAVLLIKGEKKADCFHNSCAVHSDISQLYYIQSLQYSCYQ